MVGWYVDIGLVPPSVSARPNNINIFDFLDIDRPLLFLEASSFHPTTRYDISGFITDLENLIDNSDALYGVANVFSTGNLASYNILTHYLPSIPLAYPSCNALVITDKLVKYGAVLYFKSLNKLVIYNSKSSLVNGIYDVLEDGTLSLLRDGSRNLHWYAVENDGTAIFVGGIYVGDYKDYTKYGTCRVEVHPNYSSFTISNIDLTYYFELLLGSDGKPDFDPDHPIIPSNPYDPIGPSGESDIPPGTFDETSDPISDSSLPTLSAANTGFTRIYNPTLAQVQQLAKYLWTDDTVIETIWNHIKQYFEDPMQAIIGFNLVPVPVPDGGTQSFALMYIDTGVEMTVAANQFVDVDCGTLAVERYYGSALDQSPYTKITCFLPYIGQVQLDTDEVMGTTLQVKYRVDIVTGSCVAKIFVDGNCLYQYTGHCAINIPISSADFSSYVSSAISIARLATTAGLAASGVVAPPTPVTTTQQTNKTTTTNTDTARNPATGRQITMGTHTTSVINETNKEVTTSQASFDGLSPQNISNTVGQIMSSKAIIQHSGSFSGNSGYLGVRRPYLIIERPNICLPANYQQLNGYPAMITMALGSCQGYTQVQQVQLTGLTATNPEQAEILSLLKGGVIF